MNEAETRAELIDPALVVLEVLNCKYNLTG
jgi:hypothetical protein